jgi:hypothetical protein
MVAMLVATVVVAAMVAMLVVATAVVAMVATAATVAMVVAAVRPRPRVPLLALLRLRLPQLLRPLRPRVVLNKTELSHGIDWLGPIAAGLLCRVESR